MPDMNPFQLFALNREQDNTALLNMAGLTPQVPDFSLGQQPPAPTAYPAGAVFQPQQFALPPNPAPAVPSNKDIASWPSIQAGIFKGESGGDYDALFGFANREGGKFAGTKLTNMTVDEALQFANPQGPYAGYVRGQVGRTATPLGAYQVVGSTLQAAKDSLGLRGDERMTKDLQDRIGKWVYENQGTRAWSGYKGPADPAMGVQSTSEGGFNTPIDTSALEKNLPDMSPQAQRRRRIGLALTDLGKGLGQMSHGQAVDLSSVLNDYLERQDEMRQRMAEVINERRRQSERKEDIGLRIGEREDQQAATAALQQQNIQNQQLMQQSLFGHEDVAREDTQAHSTSEREASQVYGSSERVEGQEFVTSERVGEHAQTIADKEAERKRLSTAATSAISLMYPDAPWKSTAGSIADVDPTTAMTWAKGQYDKGIDQQSRDAMQQAFSEVPQAAAAAAQGDMDNATKLYMDATGQLPDPVRINQYIRAHPDEATNIMKIIRGQSGAVDPYENKMIEIEGKNITDLNEGVNQSQNAARSMRLALDLVNNPKLSTGKFHELLLPLNQYLADIGIGDPETVNQQTLLQGISKGLATKMRVKGDIISDSDVGRLEQQVSSVGKSPETNAALLYSQIELARREKVYADARSEAFMKHLSGEQMTQFVKDKLLANNADNSQSIFTTLNENGDLSRVDSIPMGTPYILEGNMVIRGQE